MTDLGVFGGALGRLLEHRQLSAAELLPDVSVADMDAALTGVSVAPELLRRLAPLLGLHTADLFVMAGCEVPDDLAAVRDSDPWDTASLVVEASRLWPENRVRLHDFLREMPVRLAEARFAAADNYPPIAGAMMLRLLRNRNIRPHRAKFLMVVGGGPYVSDSTVAMLGTGRVSMTPRYVAAFANVLGIPHVDLAAVTGIGGPVEDVRPHSDHVQLAGMAWDARRLTGEQRSRAMSLATDLRRTQS